MAWELGRKGRGLGENASSMPLDGARNPSKVPNFPKSPNQP